MPAYSHPKATLSIEQVLEIRAYAAAGISPKEIGEAFGQAGNKISAIISGNRYGSIKEGIIPNLRLVHHRGLTPEQVLFMRLTYSENVSARTLAKAYGIHLKTVLGILKGKTYADVPGAITLRTDRDKRILTDEQVIWARRMYRTGQISCTQIAMELGMKRTPMLAVIRGHFYKELPGAVPAHIKFRRGRSDPRPQRLRRLAQSMSASSTPPA